ncbi:MAG: hypothetical protein KKD31_07375, partial [Bacteroidetes bacterium]|nr:hypothetical protein [Bacteroidota bacterium]
TQIQSEKDDLELELTEKEQRIDELEDEIKTKNSIKFYAGLAGDVLESIGIKKSMLKKSLAGIMKSNPSEHSETTSENTTSLPDNSGIVDDDTPETQTGKRSEMINLIREYLPTTRDDVLTNIFAIFSEIEQDGELSYRLLKYIEEEKE